MRRHPRRQERQPLPGPGTDPPGVRRHFGAIRKDVAAGLSSATTMARTTCPTTSRARSPSCHRGLAVLRAPARGQRRGRALHPYAEGKPLVGCATSRPSKSCAWRCSISPPVTIPTGWSPAMATGHLLRSGPTSNRPWIRPHEQGSRLSHNRGAVQKSAATPARTSSGLRRASTPHSLAGAASGALEPGRPPRARSWSIACRGIDSTMRLVTAAKSGTR